MALPLLGAIAGGIQLATGIGQLFSGRKKINRPDYQIQNEYYENLADAQNQARVGMQSQQYNNATTGLQRNLNAGLRTLRGSNTSAGLASLIRSQNDAILNLNAQDANMRAANQRNVLNQRAMLGAQKSRKFQWDVIDKYGEQLANRQAKLGSGMQNIAGAVNNMATMSMADQYGGGDYTNRSYQKPVFGANQSGALRGVLGAQGIYT